MITYFSEGNMKVAIKPENEDYRIRILEQLEILDTDIDQAYENITHLAAQICQVPICLVSLVDEERQWFKSHYGLGARETPRDFAFCAHAILGETLFEVKDAKQDERFHDNPLVTGEPHVIFYAGHPLKVEDDVKLGTLCVIDHKPRELSEEQKHALQVLGEQVELLLKLRRANKRIKRSQEAKETMFATMSHEIRTPLNGIIGMSELMLEESRLDPTMMKAIHDCSLGLLTLVNEILEFSKLEAGKIQIKQEPFDILEAVESVMFLFESAANRKGVKLVNTQDRNAESKLLLGDSFRIRQIVQNLVSNAIKFTANGQVETTTKIREIDKDSCEIVITVADTGIGIAERQLKRLFESYAQANSSIAEKFGGTGLGLSICKSLVDQMGGGISVSSQEHIGTEFTVTIPLRFANKAQDANKQTSSIKPNYNIRVLVAEDNNINQVIAQRMLTSFGCEVTIAKDGEEAVDLVRNESFDLVFMDCHMPNMSGIEASKIINSRPNPPMIIALTAAATESEQRACFEAGMTEFLTKPITKKSIRQLLSKILHKAA